MAEATIDGRAALPPATSGITPWKAFPADPADWFSPEEIDKAKRYTGPLRRVALAGKLVGLAAEVAFVLAHGGPRILDALDLGNGVLELVVLILVLAVIGTIVGVPFQAWQELRHDKEWGFSTQTTGGFVADLFKGLALGTVMNAVLFIPLWAVLSAQPDTWWVWGWLITAVFAVGLGLLYPVLIAPIFNKFTPLEDQELRTALLERATQAEADISEVLVSDASKRSRKENAYVAGMGSTRQVVLFDTLLKRPAHVVDAIVAHEIGHWKRRHLVRTVPLMTVLLFVNYLVLYAVLQSDTILDLAGVDHLADPAAFPLFALVFPLPSILITLVMSWLSRAHERDADLFALELTREPAHFVEAMRGLHTDNLADLTPSLWKRLTMSHPPAAERMAMGTAWGRAAGLLP